MMVILYPVQSSMLASVGYDPQKQILYVLFNSGTAYEYHNVPPDVYQELLQAESIGQYMQENIIDHYSYAQFSGWDK